MSWAMAERANQSAHVLMSDGDARGAANRAYYAMFYAARVSLAASEPALVDSKRHPEILRRFSKHFVLERGANPKLGSVFKNAYKLRIDADCGFAPVDRARVERALGSLALFLSELKSVTTVSTP